MSGASSTAAMLPSKPAEMHRWQLLFSQGSYRNSEPLVISENPCAGTTLGLRQLGDLYHPASIQTCTPVLVFFFFFVISAKINSLFSDFLAYCKKGTVPGVGGKRGNDSGGMVFMENTHGKGFGKVWNAKQVEVDTVKMTLEVCCCL